MPKPIKGSSTSAIPIQRPRLTNRGGAGLLGKLPKNGKATPEPTSDKPVLTQVQARYPIAPSLQNLAVPIDSVLPDPENARLHPERNMASIKASLFQYGQVKPLVARTSTRVVMAGNGTLAAAKELGYTEIAVTFVDMSDVEAVGFGLADNRTAELAKWDFEIFARLDKILQTHGHDTIGWSQDELEVLRMADWTPPVISDEAFGGTRDGKDQPLLVSFTPDQYEVINRAIEGMRLLKSDSSLDQAVSLYLICHDWLELREVK